MWRLSALAIVGGLAPRLSVLLSPCDIPPCLSFLFRLSRLLGCTNKRSPWTGSSQPQAGEQIDAYRHTHTTTGHASSVALRPCYGTGSANAVWLRPVHCNSTAYSARWVRGRSRHRRNVAKAEKCNVSLKARCILVFAALPTRFFGSWYNRGHGRTSLRHSASPGRPLRRRQESASRNRGPAACCVASPQSGC